jgi:hypothetical protein
LEAGLLEREEKTPDSPLSYRCFDRHCNTKKENLQVMVVYCFRRERGGESCQSNRNNGDTRPDTCQNNIFWS